MAALKRISVGAPRRTNNAAATLCRTRKGCQPRLTPETQKAHSSLSPIPILTAPVWIYACFTHSPLQCFNFANAQLEQIIQIWIIQLLHHLV